MYHLMKPWQEFINTKYNYEHIISACEKRSECILHICFWIVAFWWVLKLQKSHLNQGSLHPTVVNASVNLHVTYKFYNIDYT